MKLQALSRTLFTVMLLLTICFANAQSTHAATLYFDGGSVDIGGNGDGSSAGVDGTWNTTIVNWDQGNGLPHVAWNNANFDNAVIGDGILTISVPVTVGSLTLGIGAGTVVSYSSSSEITLKGGISFADRPITWGAPIKLAGNQTWWSYGSNSTGKSLNGVTDLNGYELTWNSTFASGSGNGTPWPSNITGTGSIVKDGSGNLGLGANTYTGSTTIKAGKLHVSSATALGNTNNQLTVNGGSLNLRGNNITVGNLTGTGGLITNGVAGTTILTIGSGDAGGGNFQGAILAIGSGDIALTKIGTGTITLSGTNTYTGETTINAGTLVITGPIVSNVTVQAAGSLSTVAGGVGTLTIGGNLDISAMAGGTGKLKFELGTPVASDQIAVSGTLTIGAGVLGFRDFEFTNLGRMYAGTYTLITSSGITGTLSSVDLKGKVSGMTATLRINGNSLEMVVLPSGTLIKIK